ncbi:hypothetical protein RUE5091_00488 [Ruegeria denitrificans]|uniref:Uncharacterized protein n=1 Tax=Ruegeria denitrificans TaxID=1715692 RepID=A0A0P1I2D6_9RHOB|nr:hypothetical protein RUE5091_00488 [Ruegeria denitrificans]
MTNPCSNTTELMFKTLIDVNQRYVDVELSEKAPSVFQE